MSRLYREFKHRENNEQDKCSKCGHMKLTHAPACRAGDCDCKEFVADLDDPLAKENAEIHNG